MMKSLKVKILKNAARLLSPYLEKEQEKRESNTLKWYLSQMKFCGKGIQIAPSYTFRGMPYISLGENFCAGAHLRLDAIESYEGVHYAPELRIGDNVVMQEFCHIGCIEKVSIGDGTLLAGKVLIIDHMHGSVTPDDLALRPDQRELSHKPVQIGKNVWIGEGVSILPGVNLGDNVIVGANSVVTHSYPANSVIAGCPAKLLKTL